jgi:ABC-type multidrug transport system ATPase subunit
MSHLKDLTNSGSTVVLATNILEDLDHYASHLLLLRKGQLSFNGTMKDFLKKNPKALFSKQVSDQLEAA